MTINTLSGSYPIYITNGFGGLIDAIASSGLSNRNFTIISDSNVSKLYLSSLTGELAKTGSKVVSCSFEAGEQHKNLDTINALYHFLISSRSDRRTVIVALGGGVTGDMAGFAASTYMRGIDFIQVPTTLLSQVDSSVGGKVGVDFENNKNIIGAFYQPKLVYINIDVLHTLDERQLMAGMGEVIKYGLAFDKELYQYVASYAEQIKKIELENISHIIRRCLEIKAEIVSKDEREQGGVRELLNFGHTFGHAFETLSGFELLHGECVALGMIAAMHVSMRGGNIAPVEVASYIDLLQCYKLPVSLDLYTDASHIYNQMLLDKKTVNGALKLILLERVGKSYVALGTEKGLVTDAVSELMSGRDK